MHTKENMRHVRLVILCSVLLGSAIAGCSKKPPPYDRLCKIYEDAGSLPLTPDAAMRLAERVEKEIPEIYDDFSMMAQADIRQRYELLKTLAREKTHEDNWECAAIRKAYPPGQM
jgi:hypothetical protein